jgi:hypothetical protein
VKTTVVLTDNTDAEIEAEVVDPAKSIALQAPSLGDRPVTPANQLVKGLGGNPDIVDVLLDDDYTLVNPTGGTDGQLRRWRFTQDATGSRMVTLGDKFRIPSSATSPLAFSTDAGAMDILAAMFNEPADKWDVVTFIPGY